MKTLLLALFLVLPLAVCGQKDVTKFLGIPVDGSKSEMIRKLKEKGFKEEESPKNETPLLVGKFNGEDVNVFIASNNNKVYRILVCDRNMRSKTNIKIRFNNLVKQFENNKKYFPGAENASEFIIPDDEDIAYEIMVNDKRYDANFYQYAENDSLLVDAAKEYIISEYGYTLTTDEFKEKLLEKTLELMSMKNVWFTISEFNSEYYISIFYDNKYNAANGQDL